MTAAYDEALRRASAATQAIKPIEIELFDGEVYKLPGDTPPEEVDHFAREMTAYHRSQKGLLPRVNQFAAGVNRATIGTLYKAADQLATFVDRNIYPAADARAALPDFVGKGAAAADDFLRHVQGENTPPVDTAGRILNKAGTVTGAMLPITGGMVAAGPRIAAATEGATSLPAVTANVLARPYAAAPARAAAVDTVSAIGAGVGGGVATEAFPGNKTAETIGMLLGGFSPAAIPLAARVSPTRLITRPAINAASRMAADAPESVLGRMPFLKPLAQRGRTLNTGDAMRARDDLLGDAMGPAEQASMTQAEALSRIIPGFRPTLAEATGSRSIASTQRDIQARASGAKLEEYAHRRAGSERAISDFAERAGPRGSGGAEFVVDGLTGRVDRLRAGVSQQALRAGEYGAENIAGAISAIDRAEIGSNLREMVSDARRATGREMNALSKSLGLDDADVSVPFNNFRKEVEADFTPGSVFEDVANYPKVVQAIKDHKSGTISFQDLKSLRERLGDDIIDAQASPVGRAQKIRMLTSLKRKVDGLMEQVASEGLFVPSGASQMLDAAKRLRRTTGPKGEDLTSFLVRKGGVRDSGGELAALDARFRPGLMNGRGLSLDDAALYAWEAGFFPGSRERPTVNEFLDALRGDLSGRKLHRLDDKGAQLNAELGEWDKHFGLVGIDWRNTPDHILEEQILRQFGTAPEGTAQLIGNYRQFLKTYREQVIDRFEHGVVQKIRQRDGTGYYRVPDEEVAASFFQPGNVSAARQFKQVFRNDPAAMDSLQAAALDDLRQFAVRDGQLVKGALQGWLRRYSSVLDEFPSIRRAVGVFEQAESALLARQQELKARADRIESQLLVRDLARVQRGQITPERLVENALNDPRKMAELRRAIRGKPALEALQRHIWDMIADRPAAEIEKFLTRHVKSLNEIFTLQHLADIKRIMSARRMLETVPPPQGQGVRSDPLKALQDTIGMGVPQLASRVFAAQSGRTSLRYVATDAFGRFFRAQRMKEFDRIMEEVIFNPEMARVVASLPGQATIPAAARNKLNSWLFAAGLAPEDEE